jgi:hypothetical protein
MKYSLQNLYCILSIRFHKIFFVCEYQLGKRCETNPFKLRIYYAKKKRVKAYVKAVEQVSVER